jgi:transposase
MADQATWAKRVLEWKASGLSSPAYCKGKPFTAGGLRFWAHRLAHMAGRASSVVRLARLRRVRARGSEVFEEPRLEPLIVEIGSARVVVRPGFDRSTLAGVLEALEVVARGR